jgi:hypothetical protein
MSFESFFEIGLDDVLNASDFKPAGGEMLTDFGFVVFERRS